MISTFIQKFSGFRNKIFNLFQYRADATMDLIDAIAGQPAKESVVKLSLSNLFRREYSSINDSVKYLFRKKNNKIAAPHEVKEGQEKVTEAIIEELCPKPKVKNFHLFAVDCTPNPRVHAKKLDDRGYVHSSNSVPGQKPITVGHQYSSVVHLPEKELSTIPPWVIPLSTLRINSDESGTCVGMSQVVKIVNYEKFKKELCVSVSDSAYSNSRCMSIAKEQNNLVNIARIRNNRKFYLPIIQKAEEHKKPGRPKKYGDRWDLNDPEKADKTVTVTRFSKKGNEFYLKIEVWYNRLEKGHTGKRSENAEFLVEKSDPFLFDAIKVTVLDKNENPKHKKPLWLMVVGEQRRSLCLEDIADCYFRRFDIEHYFRFAKQKLLLDKFQTPEVRHEENWHWLCLMSYNMLYGSKELARLVKNKWETKKSGDQESYFPTPTEVQRDYERIIGGIGTPSRIPKPRGKAPGRPEGFKAEARKDKKIIKKSKKSLDEIEKTAA